MGKSNLKKNTTAKTNKMLKLISRKEFRGYVVQRQVKQESSLKKLKLYKQQLSEISSEQTFECSVCLQTYLRPVIAKCGHIFCLTCMEELAKNHYACGICHDDQPTFEIKVDKTIQELVYLYLSKCPAQEKRHYQKRQKEMQAKQADRSVGILKEGDYIDFWCEEDKSWKSGLVHCINECGQVYLRQHCKTEKMIQINILSRRLARHRCYTKEPMMARVDPMMNHQEQLFRNESIRPLPQMIGMPLFFNFYGGFQPSNIDNSNLFGYLRRFGNNQFHF